MKKTAVEMKSIPPDQLRANPWNTRLWYPRDEDDPYLRSLRDSIEKHGRNFEAVLVRPIEQGLYEIVFGECRMRAIRMSEKVREVWCEVREMNDQAAFDACLDENTRRKDMHPLEEAEMLGKARAMHPDWTIDDLASHLRMPRRTVVRRLALLNLTPAWMDAIRSRTHGVSTWPAPHLERVAAVPPEIQDAYLKEISSKSSNVAADEIPLSELRSDLAENYSVLGAVPWDLDDPAVVSGLGACTGCQWRSGAQPELFEDVDFRRQYEKNKPGERCLKKACFDAKYKAALLRAKEEAEKKIGKKVQFIGDYQQRQGVMKDQGVVEAYGLTSCKKTDPKAVPVIDLSKGDGKVKWMKKDSYSEAKPKKTAEEKAAAKEAKQARAKWAEVCARLAARLEGEDHTILAQETIIALYAAKDWNRLDWDSYGRYRNNPGTALKDMYDGVRQGLVDTLQHPGAGLDLEQEVRLVCAVFGLDLGEFTGESADAESKGDAGETRAYSRINGSGNLIDYETFASIDLDGFTARAYVAQAGDLDWRNGIDVRWGDALIAKVPSLAAMPHPTPDRAGYAAVEDIERFVQDRKGKNKDDVVTAIGLWRADHQQRGVCRYCGCTQEFGCPDEGGVGCHWVDAGETICSVCQAARRDGKKKGSRKGAKAQ